MIIFSAFQGTEADNANHQQAISEIRGAAKEVIGVYKNQQELSILTDDIEKGRELARQFNQESYLERGHRGRWYLIETESSNVLATFKTIKQVPKAEALANDCYTIMDGQYYLGV